MQKNLKNIAGLEIKCLNPLNEEPTDRKPVYNTFFFVKNGSSLTRITFDAITFITVEGQYCKMITEKGNFLIQISLSQFLNSLPQPQFLRTHRNYIVNFKKIECVYLDDNLIILNNGERILLSRTYKVDFIRNCKIFR